MTKRMIIMLLLAGVVFGGVFGFQAFKAGMIRKFMSTQTAPVQTVATSSATVQEWPATLKAVGTLRAVRGVDVAPEVAGIVASIEFKSGDAVKAGAVLVQLRADSDAAKLAALRSAADLAQSSYARDLEQFKARAVSQATLDVDLANLKTTKAQLDEQQALLEKTIRAPFSGRLGIRQADLGQYLGAGQKIATLQALDPIYADFALPERELSRIRIGAPVAAAVDTFEAEEFKGEITAIDPKVDPETRNLQVRARFRNSGQTLLPGMFASVTIETGEPRRFLTLPQSAISYNPYGDTVFVVEAGAAGADGKTAQIARQRFVELGERRGDQVAVLKGVRESDAVVVAGQLKLRNGTPVTVDNTVRPSSDPAPKVLDR